MDVQLARATLERSRRDPAWWSRTWLGVDLWPKQVEQLCAWRDHRRTSFRSCNGIGKTLGNAVGVLYIGSCFEDTLVLTTATTFTQIRGSVWSEIALLVQRARLPLGCEVLQTEIRWPHGSRAIGITAPATDATKMQGYRGRRRTFILGDEAGGLSAPILEGINSMLTGQEAHLLLTGNPTDPTTEFKRTFNPDRTGVYKIKVSAFDTPNFTAFGITLPDIVDGTWAKKIAGRPYPMPNLITPEWVADLYEQCSRNVRDPRFVARVLGDFPEGAPDTLIPMHWIEASIALGKLPPTKDEPTTPCILGTDPAWRGDDSSAIARRRGRRTRVLTVVHGQDPMQVTGATAKALADEKATAAHVDEIGIGAGVLARGREIGLPFIGINVGQAPRNRAKFRRLRDEVWWNLRELLEQTYRASLGEKDSLGRTIEPALLLEENDPQLIEELNAPRWSLNSDGRIVVEEKDDTKKRIKRSPDRADAVGLAWTTPPGFVPAVAPNTEGLERRPPSAYGRGTTQTAGQRFLGDDDDDGEEDD